MATYFFHLRDGQDILIDPEGRELDGAGAIAKAALAEARAIISADAQTGRIMLDQHIDVEDAEGRVVHQLHFMEAVEIVRSR